MQDVFDQILSYIKGIWRYRWYTLITAWLICLVSWPIVFSLPDQYEASAQVYVDTAFILPNIVGVGPLTDPQTRVRAMSRTLLTRPNLEEIVRKSDLDLGVHNASDMRALISRFRENIRLTTSGLSNAYVRGRRNDDIYVITYHHENPQIAKNVVQATLTLFVEKTLRKGGELTDRVEGFLDQRIAEKEAEVRDIETLYESFKRENVDLLPASGQNFSQYIRQLETQLEAATLAAQQAQTRKQNLDRELSGETPSFGLGAGLPPMVLESDDTDSDFGFETFAASINNLPEQVRLQNLQQQLDLLLLKYTARHPDVVTLRQVIAELQGQVRQKLQTLYNEEKARLALSNVNQQSGRQSGQSADEYHFRLKFQAIEVQAEIDALKLQIDNLTERLGTLREKRDLLPAIETQMQRLQSDLAVAKTQLADLKARQKKVELGIKVGESEDIRFEIIEPPFVPAAPAGPNRPLLFSGALLVALAVGLALAFVIAQLRSTFDTRRSLMLALHAPVIGSVSAFWSPMKIRRQRLNLLAYYCLLAGLFIAYAGLLLVDTKGINIPFI